MPLKRLGSPPFLSSDEIKDRDILEIVDKPYLMSAEKSKWGKERYRAVCKKPDDREFGLRTVPFNVTSWNRLLEAFGADETLWPSKKIRVRKSHENVLGKDRTVLYWEPYIDPQKQLEERA